MAFSWRKFLQRNLLTILTVVGVFSGTACGLILRSVSGTWNERDTMYLAFPGELFLRMLKSLIIPLLTTSIISAVGGLDLSLSKRVALRAILYYATTTVCAVILGIILVSAIQPGKGAKSATGKQKNQLDRRVLTQDTLLDLVRNLFPPNLVQACIQQAQTLLIPPANYTDEQKEKANTSELVTWAFKEKYENMTNVLGLVMFSIVLGIALGQMKEKGKPLIIFFDTVSEAMMIITGWVIWLSPFGVFFLVAAKMVSTEDFTDLAGRLGLYFATVMLGLVLHGFGTISVIYFIATKRLPFRVIGKLGQVLATAFGTASSSATMPITIQTLDKMGLDPRITRFVIPVGATINMDGTALYEAVAAIFIAQLKGKDMSIGKMAGVCITATAASIGAAGIPQAGLVTMVMVLETVGLPGDEVINILAVDWLLDRFRTTINVMCDCIGARLVDILSAGELDKTPELDRLNADPQELVEMKHAPN